MSIETVFGGTVETALVELSSTSTIDILEADQSDLLVHSIAYASAAGDTLTLDTHDGTSASRLRQAAIAANGDGVFFLPFVLSRGSTLRGTLSTGNATPVRVTYTIRNS